MASQGNRGNVLSEFRIGRGTTVTAITDLASHSSQDEYA
jgi:hypothetical protein